MSLCVGGGCKSRNQLLSAVQRAKGPIQMCLEPSWLHVGSIQVEVSESVSSSQAFFFHGICWNHLWLENIIRLLWPYEPNEPILQINWYKTNLVEQKFVEWVAKGFLFTFLLERDCRSWVRLHYNGNSVSFYASIQKTPLPLGSQRYSELLSDERLRSHIPGWAKKVLFACIQCLISRLQCLVSQHPLLDHILN